MFVYKARDFVIKILLVRGGWGTLGTRTLSITEFFFTIPTAINGTNQVEALSNKKKEEESWGRR